MVPEPERRSRKGYLATVGAIWIGSTTAGVAGLFLGLVLGLLVVGVIGTVLHGGPNGMTDDQMEAAVNLVPVVVGVPCIALFTAVATYFLVEGRQDGGWIRHPRYAAARATVWSAAALNSAAFGALAVLSPQSMFKLIGRAWAWPLYVVPIGLAARWIALHLSQAPSAEVDREALWRYVD